MSLSGPFLFDPRSFWGDENVRMMSEREVCCYLRLLSHQWEEGSIPDDPKRLSAILSEGLRTVTPEDLSDGLWQTLSQCFETDKNGRLKNPRLGEEREKWVAKQESFSKSGRKGGLQKAANAANKQLASHPKATLKAPSSHPLAKVYPPSSISSSVSSSSSSSVSKKKSARGATTPKKKKQGREPPEVEIPESLDTPEFQAAWEEFKTMRREKRASFPPSAQRKQLKALSSKLDAHQAAACVDHSTANGYTGIFPEKFVGKGGGPSRHSGEHLQTAYDQAIESGIRLES